MSPSCEYTSIGGQAVIEGVTLRSQRFLVVAVRRSSGGIVLRSEPTQDSNFSQQFRRTPFLRGVVYLIQSLLHGIEALGYSAQVASDHSKDKEQTSSLELVLTIGAAFLLGLGFFVVLPQLFSEALIQIGWLEVSPRHFLINLVEACARVFILLSYLVLIGSLKDIRTLFQYHGAEHLCRATFEAGEELIVENAQRHSILHPRCETNFLLYLILFSIFTFTPIFSYYNLGELSGNPVVNQTLSVLIKALLFFPLASVTFELVKFIAFRMHNPLVRILAFPVMQLQRLSLRKPTNSQIEVALVALRQILRLEKGVPSPGAQSAIEPTKGVSGLTLQENEEEFEIASLSDLGRVQASVKDFLE